MSKDMPNSYDYVESDTDLSFSAEHSLISPLTGEVLYTFSDDAAHDCPEDLLWYRDIGELYDAAFRIGWEARGKADE